MHSKMSQNNLSSLPPLMVLFLVLQKQVSMEVYSLQEQVSMEVYSLQPEDQVKLTVVSNWCLRIHLERQKIFVQDS